MSALPFLIRRLRDLHAIDEAQQHAFAREGVLTLSDLDTAIAEGRPLAASAAIRRAAPGLRNEQRPVSLGRAWDILDPLLSALSARCPEIQALEPAGGVRRGEPLVADLSVVGRASDPPAAIDSAVGLSLVTDVLHRSTRRALVLVQGHEIDIRVAAPEEHGTVLFSATGPPSHVVEVQKRRGVRLAASETEVYTHAGLAYLPPQVRHWSEAMDAAVNRTLPRLVQHEDIAGDLHMHTTYSDGRDSLRRMVRTGQALGYEYIAITDHSEHAGASRTLTPRDLARQRDEIDGLRDEMDGLTILHGLEVDILPDGSLDCPDAILASLDIVLASLHDSAGHDRKRLTARCLGAMRHPLVTIITHPMNQLVGRRKGYDMDYPALYAAAVETGTALEIDGAPSHLDLDGAHAREAAAAGVTLVVDSDCHRASALERQMSFAVATARRGGVEPGRVLNTRPLSDVLEFIARKRRG